MQMEDSCEEERERERVGGEGNQETQREDGSEEEGGGGREREDSSEERQRAKLLGAALKEARGGLVAALGETRFEALYTSVMEADAGGLGGEESPSWGADRHGWQMLQYVYLEEETRRIRGIYE